MCLGYVLSVRFALFFVGGLFCFEFVYGLKVYSYVLSVIYCKGRRGCVEFYILNIRLCLLSFIKFELEFE